MNYATIESIVLWTKYRLYLHLFWRIVSQRFLLTPHDILKGVVFILFFTWMYHNLCFDLQWFSSTVEKVASGADGVSDSPWC